MTEVNKTEALEVVTETLNNVSHCSLLDPNNMNELLDRVDKAENVLRSLNIEYAYLSHAVRHTVIHNFISYNTPEKLTLLEKIKKVFRYERKTKNTHTKGAN